MSPAPFEGFANFQQRLLSYDRAASHRIFSLVAGTSLSKRDISLDYIDTRRTYVYHAGQTEYKLLLLHI